MTTRFFIAWYPPTILNHQQTTFSLPYLPWVMRPSNTGGQSEFKSRKIWIDNDLTLVMAGSIVAPGLALIEFANGFILPLTHTFGELYG